MPSGLGKGPGAGPAGKFRERGGQGLGQGGGRLCTRPDGPSCPSEGWTELGSASGCQLM